MNGGIWHELRRAFGSYQYDAANRLTCVDGVGYTFDNNGNLLDDGSRTFAYDAANRLISVTNGSLTTEFAYDGLGNRLAQVVDGVTTAYGLDVAGGLPQVIVETTNGQTTAYLPGLAQDQGAAWAYYLPDALGSIRHLTDASAQVTLARSYEPFGKLLAQAGTGSSGFGFAGEQRDASTGLVFLRARYYDPALGRFVSKDPFPGNLLRPQTQNPFAYVTNNPIRFTDPLGYDGGEDEPEISSREQFLIDFLRLIHSFDFCLGALGCWGGPEYAEWNAENNLPYLDENLQRMIHNPWEAAGHGHVQELSDAIAQSKLTQENDGLIIGVSGVSAFYAFSFVNPKNGANPDRALEPLKFGNECLAASGVTGGYEIVYDFKHQERGLFSYSGNVFNFPSYYNGGVAYYVGKSRGFANQPYRLGVSAYSGGFAGITYNAELFLPDFLAGFSVGASKIEAAGLTDSGAINPEGVFATYYGLSVGGGISSPVNVDIAVTDYTLQNRERYVPGMANAPESQIKARKQNIAYRAAVATVMMQEINLLGGLTNPYIQSAIPELWSFVYRPEGE